MARLVELDQGRRKLRGGGVDGARLGQVPVGTAATVDGFPDPMSERGDEVTEVLV
nr:hypothetical protein [Haloarcula sp. CBA1131]